MCHNMTRYCVCCGFIWNRFPVRFSNWLMKYYSTEKPINNNLKLLVNQYARSFGLSYIWKPIYTTTTTSYIWWVVYCSSHPIVYVYNVYLSTPGFVRFFSFSFLIVPNTIKLGYFNSLFFREFSVLSFLQGSEFTCDSNYMKNKN